MAVLHHAFRCPTGRKFDEDVACIIAASQAGDLASLSTLALDGYAVLADREDLHTAFLIHPEGPVSAWMQPSYVSAGLATLAVLAGRMVTIPNLSASGDTNHYLLETHLPALGWSAADVAMLVRGQPIETMLQVRAEPTQLIEQGGFRLTGGWTPGARAQAMKDCIERLMEGPSPHAANSEVRAWNILNDSGALADAQAMLAEIGESDWLVMAITH